MRHCHCQRHRRGSWVLHRTMGRSTAPQESKDSALRAARQPVPFPPPLRTTFPHSPPHEKRGVQEEHTRESFFTRSLSTEATATVRTLIWKQDPTVEPVDPVDAVDAAADPSVLHTPPPPHSQPNPNSPLLHLPVCVCVCVCVCCVYVCVC